MAKAAVAAVTEIPAKPREPVRFMTAHFSLKESKQREWIAYAPPNMMIEDLKDPDAFILFPAGAVAYDTLLVISDHNRWKAGFDVLDAREHGGATLSLDWFKKLPPKGERPDNRLPRTHGVYRDPDSGRWFAYKLVDGEQEIMNRDSVREEDAIRYILDHPSVRG